jgi:hypothetical protein
MPIAGIQREGPGNFLVTFGEDIDVDTLQTATISGDNNTVNCSDVSPYSTFGMYVDFESDVTINFTVALGNTAAKSQATGAAWCPGTYDVPD